MKFAYRQYQTTPSATGPGGILRRPEVPLRIIGTMGALSLWSLVDTGSDETLFPLSAGQVIGAKLDPNQTWQAEGIGGQSVRIMLGDVELELTDGGTTFHWQTNVGFVDFSNPQDEASVAGHAGFLDFFRVVCDGHQHEVEIAVTPSFRGKVT